MVYVYECVYVDVCVFCGQMAKSGMLTNSIVQFKLFLIRKIFVLHTFVCRSFPVGKMVQSQLKITSSSIEKMQTLKVLYIQSESF